MGVGGLRSELNGPLLPLVQLGGVALLSTAVVLVGFSATAIALEIVKWWRTGGQPRAGAADTASEADVDQRPPAVLLPGICICLVLFTAVIVWPQVRHAGAGSGGEPTVTVAAVQGNVPRLGFDFNAQRRAVLDNHVQETLRLAEDVRAGVAPQPQFVIWPEDASDIDPLTQCRRRPTARTGGPCDRRADPGRDHSRCAGQHRRNPRNTPTP